MARVIRTEGGNTRLVRCEKLYLVVNLTTDEEERENSVAGSEASG